MNLNQVNLIGHLTRDPETRYTPKGTAVTKIGLAVNREWKDDKGGKKSEVTFIDVTCWARLAEVAGEYLTKGSPVYFGGRLSTESWDDKATGKKRTKTIVVADHMQLLSRRNEEPKARDLPPPGQSPAAAEDDIPF